MAKAVFSKAISLFLQTIDLNQKKLLLNKT